MMSLDSLSSAFAESNLIEMLLPVLSKKQQIYSRFEKPQSNLMRSKEKLVCSCMKNQQFICPYLSVKIVHMVYMEPTKG